MRRPAAFIIALALGAMTLTPGSGARRTHRNYGMPDD